MPQRKKLPKNAFYFYLKDYQLQLEREGRPVAGGMHVLAIIGLPSWNALPPDKKRKYEEIAEEFKAQQRGCPEGKFTNAGISYAQHVREEQEKEERKRRMVLEIETTVRNLDRAQSLQEYCFYFIHFNYYCRTEEGLFYPCEVAVVEFSLENGVQRTLHTFIDPGDLPMGFTYEAQLTSDETHRIELPPLDRGITYQETLTKIKEFLTANRSTKRPINQLPPLYTRPNCEESVTSILREFSRISCEDPDAYKVYLLPKLFYELRNAAASGDPNSVFPAQSIAEQELEDDIFSFTKGISCSWHEETDATQFCSLSIVRRWCFTIADHCCHFLNIRLILGRHCPEMANTKLLNSKRGSIIRPKFNNNDTDWKNDEVQVQQIKSPESGDAKHDKIDSEDSEDDESKPIRRPMTRGVAALWAVREAPHGIQEPITVECREMVGRGAFRSLPENPVAVAGRGAGPGRVAAAGYASAGHGRGRRI